MGRNLPHNASGHKLGVAHGLCLSCRTQPQVSSFSESAHLLHTTPKLDTTQHQKRAILELVYPGKNAAEITTTSPLLIGGLTIMYLRALARRFKKASGDKRTPGRTQQVSYSFPFFLSDIHSSRQENYCSTRTQ